MIKIPRLLMSDAYSISSGHLESEDAKKFSRYYLTFRKSLSSHPDWFGDERDNRILVAGLQTVINKLFSERITHEEIDETIKFLMFRKATTKGLRHYDFDVEMWRRVVNEFDGYPPIIIEGVKEGTTVYPNEPVVRVYSTVEGFGPLCAWWESTIINYLWSASERLTWARHWLEYNRNMISDLEPKLPMEQVNFLASLSTHDFGDRAAMCREESEHVAYQHLYCFPGTDTFSAAYLAWKSGALNGTGVSVDALAHRVVQGFAREEDCYRNIYDSAQDGDIISLVSDTYDFKNAVERYLVPLALESKEKNNGKVVVCRPDSGDALEQILWTCDLAERNGLVSIDSTGRKAMTTLRIIEGDSMCFASMKKINEELIKRKWLPHKTLIYGVGGYLRNVIKRDNLSTKFALYDCNGRPTIKLSNSPGKETLPAVRILRDPDSLNTGITLVDPTESDQDLMVNYYNGLAKEKFGPGMKDRFPTIQDRILNDFNTMPHSAGKISQTIQGKVNDIIRTYRGAK